MNKPPNKLAKKSKNKQYVLVDLENVSARNLSLLQAERTQVKLFVGKTQNRIHYDIVTAMQRLGDRAEYIKIPASGKNALDFHVAYCLGAMVEREPNAHYHVIAKDTGYDPLITYMRSQKISIHRHTNIEDLSESKSKLQSKPVDPKNPAAVSKPESKPADPKQTAAERYERVRLSLESRGRSRPRKPETLHSTIRALFTPPLHPKDADTLIDQLAKKGIVKVMKNTVTYSFVT